MDYYPQKVKNKKRFFTKYSVVNHLLFMLLNITLLMLLAVILIILVTLGLVYFIHEMMYWAGIVAFTIVFGSMNFLAIMLSITAMIGVMWWYVYRCEWQISALAWFFISVLITGILHMSLGHGLLSTSKQDITFKIIETFLACLVLPSLNTLYFRRIMKYDDRFH